MKRSRLRPAALLAAVVVIAGCASDGPLQVAGGTDTEVVGIVVLETGVPAEKVIVALIPHNYNPLRPEKTLARDTTGPDGSFAIAAADAGAFNLVGVCGTHELMFIERIMLAAHGRTDIGQAFLTIPGAIKALIPETVDPVAVFVPGTELVADPIVQDSLGNWALFPTVPAATGYMLALSSTDSTEQPVVFDEAITVNSGKETVRSGPYTNWLYKNRITINTSPSGADVMDTVAEFPLLLRLDPSFPFLQARGDGEDIRFTDMEGSFLRHSIERWDSIGQKAEIWVRLKTLAGNRADTYITMYWGNPKAYPRSDDPVVFRGTDGVFGAWHLGDTGDSVMDASWKANHGVAGTGLATVEGLIAGCRRFDGVDDYVNLGADSTLSASRGMTLSGWIRIAHPLADDSMTVLSRGALHNDTTGFGLVVHPARGLLSVWSNGVTASTSVSWDSQWHHCAVSFSHSAVRVSVDGRELILAGSKLSYPAFSPLPLLMGASALNSRGNELHLWFAGDLDEVRVSGNARTSAWIKLEYENQRADQSMVVYPW